MRCDVINAVYKEQRYEVSITESSTCYSLEELENLYGIVELVLEYEDGREIESIEGTNWLKENKVYVGYKLKEAYQEYENFIQSVLWYGEVEKSCSKENLSECLRYEVSADLIKNSVVNLQVVFEVEGVEFITQNQKNVLLDLQRPSVVEGSIKYDNSLSSVNEREVEFEISDGNGSGIKEYAIISSTNCESIEYEENKQSSEGGVEKVYLNNGEYYICVKDKVGNVSNEEETRETYFKVENVDQTKDRIKYEIESQTKGSNDWYQAITIRGVFEENGSGIDRVISCVTTEKTCEPSNVERVSNNRFSKKLSSNVSAQRICARVIDKAGNVSDLYCSSAYKVDEANPSASISVNSSTSGSNGWYKALCLKASLGDSHSGVASAKYCTTTGSTCTPSTSARISNNQFTVTLGSNESAQKVCANVTDKSGRTSSKVCSSAYKVDTTNPTAKISLSTSENTITVSANGSSDSHSGIASYKYSKDNKTWYSSSKNTYTFSGLADGTYTIYVKVVDNAGRESSVVSAKKTVETGVILYDKSKGILGNWKPLYIQECSQWEVTSSHLWLHAHDDYTVHDDNTSGYGTIYLASEAVDLTDINTIYLNYSVTSAGDVDVTVAVKPATSEIKDLTPGCCHCGSTFGISTRRVIYQYDQPGDSIPNTPVVANNLNSTYDVSSFEGKYYVILEVGAGDNYDDAGGYIYVDFYSIYGKK